MCLNACVFMVSSAEIFLITTSNVEDVATWSRLKRKKEKKKNETNNGLATIKLIMVKRL